MRITIATKSATRQRILEAAERLFLADGWENTTTRGIATAAGIATGTLFNYFPTKEAIASSLIAGVIERAGEDSGERTEESSLEADLFSLIWSGLRRLRDYRRFLGSAIDTVFSPLARPTPESPGEALRLEHLERVDSMITAHGYPGPRHPVTIQLYWTLYLGIFAFWAADDSPGQEDTLALLDRSLKLFVASLSMGQEATNEHK